MFQHNQPASGGQDTSEYSQGNTPPSSQEHSHSGFESPQGTYQYHTNPNHHPPMYLDQKSRLVAGLLQIFVGFFGIGRFYLGYTGIAVAQLLVSLLTCGLGFIWPFIDGILILTGSVATDSKGIPLKE
ncbi:MAG: TM2 domain-containing protein [Dehalococcoidia bacterium]|nr:TM2 domain-containing protein [Dehalococcoidia bacterium]